MLELLSRFGVQTHPSRLQESGFSLLCFRNRFLFFFEMLGFDDLVVCMVETHVFTHMDLGLNSSSTPDQVVGDLGKFASSP